MFDKPLLKGGSVIQQIFRWFIPFLYAALTFFNAMMIDWRNINWYNCDFAIYELSLILLTFIILALTTQNKSLRIATAFISFAYLIEFIVFLLSDQGDNDVLFYSNTFFGFFPLIKGMLLLTGVILLCSDTEFFSKIPRIASIFIFLLTCQTIILPLLWFGDFKITFNYTPHSFLYYIVTLLNTATAFLAMLFWYFVLSSKLQSNSAAQINMFKNKPLCATAVVIIISYVILRIYSSLMHSML